jgi:hypothetical protein
VLGYCGGATGERQRWWPNLMVLGYYGGTVREATMVGVASALGCDTVEEMWQKCLDLVCEIRLWL